MRVFAVKRFYHTSPALSTPHRRSLGHPHPPHLPLSYGDFRGLENENSYTIKYIVADCLYGNSRAFLDAVDACVGITTLVAIPSETRCWLQRPQTEDKSYRYKG